MTEKPRFPTKTKEQMKAKDDALRKQREDYDRAAKLGREILKDEKYKAYKDAYIEEEKRQIKELKRWALNEPNNDRFSNIARTILARLDTIGSLIDYVDDDLNKGILFKEDI